ncbi:hypothetical protein ACET3Z_012220 [Daucus carota]
MSHFSPDNRIKQILQPKEDKVVSASSLNTAIAGPPSIITGPPEILASSGALATSYFLLENVRFGILEAGAFGVPQSWKRAFVWAASPEKTLPEWPEPMHVFSAPELKVALPGNKHYAAVRST